MKNLLRIGLSALLLAGAVSCGSEPNYKKDFDVVATQQDELITIDLGKIRGNIEVGLSEFVEPLEVIQLEGGSQDMMFERGRMAISENYILTGRTLKLFDRKTGKFITQVGNQGRGPGEYALLYDVQISEKDNRIFPL